MIKGVPLKIREWFKDFICRVISNYIAMGSGQPGYIPMMKQKTIKDKCKSMQKRKEKLLAKGEKVTEKNLMEVVTENKGLYNIWDKQLNIHMDEWKYYARQIVEGKKI